MRPSADDTPCYCFRTDGHRCMQKLDQNFPAIDEPSDAMVDLAISIMKSVLFLEHPPRVEKGLPWVKSNFARFGLLDEQVVFLQGWFNETLPTAPGLNAIAVLRLDGDTFESTIDALNVCYPKLSSGGESSFVHSTYASQLDAHARRICCDPAHQCRSQMRSVELW